MEEGRELPVGWFETSLGDLIDRIEAGKNFRCIERPPSTGEVGVVKVSAVSWGNFRQDESKTVPVGVELSPGSLIKKGDLLFSRANTIDLVGACVQVASIDKELHLSDKILRLVTTDESLKPWMHRFLSSPGARKHLSEASSGNQLSMRNISQKVLLETAIPLAPLNEQRRIAAKLDTTLAAVDACRQRLDGVEALLKRFRQAVLAAATSGELTREWRGERTDGLEWYQAKLSEICSSISDGDHQAPPKATSGIPFITISAISDACLHLERASRFVPSSYYEGLDEARRAVPGDILYSVTGTLGVPALVKTKDPFVFQRHIALLRPDRDFILPKYLYYCLLSDAIKRLCYEGATGTAQLTLPLGVLRNLSLKLPSLVEQAEILLQIENLFSLAHQLEARLTTARKVVDRLTPALLAKAFRGELVPQDPGDEPASVLLERIRAARQAEAGAGKPSRRGRPKAAANPDQLPLDAAPVPPDFLAGLLRECGPLSERALLAVSELEPQRFQQQLYRELESGTAREVQDNGQVLLEAVG
jgi:type I restriction enzyme S subunit